MGWIGKIVGGSLGLVLGGGPLGGILGAALGHFFLDRSSGGASTSDKGFINAHQEIDNESAQLLYFTLLFTLLAKIARADGLISRNEGQHLLQCLDHMQLTEKQRRLAINIFNNAKNKPVSAVECAQQFYSLQHHQPEVIKTLFEQLVQMAVIDGPNASKKSTLDQVALTFHLNPIFLLFVYQKYGIPLNNHYSPPGQQTLVDPYKVLGVSSRVSDDELRATYRKLVRETHPDSLLANGVPPEFRRNAEKRFKEIQEAWEMIRKERRL